jgi:hypothetical protein
MSDERITNNCFICNKKLPIFIIKCRCNNIFCNIHRYHTDHGCKYDYKRKYKEELKIKLDNSNIKKIKIDKI